MSILVKLASSQGRRDEVPNQELATELAENKDREAIQEVVTHLSHSNKKIQNDCIKVLYEIGYICPELIAPYMSEFLRLLKNRHNRLVWGGMIALSTIAEIKAIEILTHVNKIYKAIETGSVITADSGIKTLSGVGAADASCRVSVFPYLMNHLKNCRPKEIPMHAEFILKAVDRSNLEEYREVLVKRKEVLTPTQLKRVERLLKKVAGRE